MSTNIGSQYRTMQQIVYETIKDGILKGVYAPGQRLITKDLATELGVSRMPVREALQRLDAATGLVTLIPRKGAVVNDSSSEKDLVEIYNLRAILEGMSTRLACPNMTEEQINKLESINKEIIHLEGTADEEYFQELNLGFHSIIWKMADSPRLIGILKLLYDASRGYRYISIKLPGRLDAIVSEHKAIIDALRKKDALLAEKIIKGHYENTLEWLVRLHKEKTP
jgi:DNA-binding GntR family transcriptional regulator